MILDMIITHKKSEVSEKKKLVPLDELKRQLAVLPHGKKSFQQALAQEGVSLIAEVKKASPSRGVLREDFDPVKIAACYEANGAAAISVLTDVGFFQGSLDHLKKIKQSVRLPVLRKDFIIDPYQIYETKAYGADALLLIAAVLQKEELTSFLKLARDLELAALVEVHCPQELEKALWAGAEIIGINNRDLKTFKTDLQTTFELAGLVPDRCLLVSESGISTVHDLKRLAEAGVDAVLVGEALVTSSDLGLKVRELAGR
ncbi:MAG: indole-3-glycerol phosphate synthase TrpC [Bacillota bacterium]|uniref:Indole-3-glycerol phosphate synthase n=1 Tax=Thermanaerosceptrum fracticalcis TaxID=1712410 RepID=A0A7G6E2I1_THEFR|nr:indole-3-glycerol phosphate synthase TrpC [Thermanaerosceptrum fracticalcis]QNB46285.1 indole-3-glycerol phosphate synthase TrpC [Thermanaerosceptrum fracticalcis]